MSTPTSLQAAAAQRILVLDGATGTEFQALKTTEADLRGTRFVDHPSSLAGNHDLLVLTQPDSVIELHLSYLLAGAVGPTNVTLSMSPRVEDPGYRTMTFRDLAESYRQQIAGLVEGDVDVLL